MRGHTRREPILRKGEEKKKLARQAKQKVWGIRAGDWKHLIRRHFDKISRYMTSGTASRRNMKNGFAN
jgi:hypothetical protein